MVVWSMGANPRHNTTQCQQWVWCLIGFNYWRSIIKLSHKPTMAAANKNGSALCTTPPPPTIATCVFPGCPATMSTGINFHLSCNPFPIPDARKHRIMDLQLRIWTTIAVHLQWYTYIRICSNYQTTTPDGPGVLYHPFVVPGIGEREINCSSGVDVGRW